MMLGKSDDADLVMVSDIDEYLLGAGKENGVNIGLATTVAHTSYGYKMGAIGVSILPKNMGSQGVMVGLENGAVKFRLNSETEPRRSNIGENRKTGWW